MPAPGTTRPVRGPCTISGRGEVSDEADPYQAAEDPGKTPVAWGALAGTPAPEVVRAKALARAGVPGPAGPGCPMRR